MKGPSRSTNHKAPEGPFPKTPVNQQSPAEEAPKSRFRSRPVSRQASQLFDGPSIVTRLRNSSYGRFHQYLQQSGLQAQLQQGFQLPRVIVVGGRSAGKSSLLESITKCPIFPRHRDFCTKMPIELHMRNDPKATERKVSISYPGRKIVHLKAAHEILAEVNAVMQTVSGIDAKPIIIEICQADVPTFEFVDLPGIQTYPEEQEQATTNLVSTYLNRPNTLILCVVDATTAAFDTSVALKLIRKAGKLSNTIVAMTKSDLVSQEEEYVPKIFDRILGQSSDNEHLRQLAGCVAVANLHDRSDISQTDGDTAERQIFNRMLHDPAEAFAPPEIQHRLKNNMTVMQLNVQLDQMFHSYNVQHWRPAALDKVDALNGIARCSLYALGPPVEELTADGVLSTVLSQIDHAHLCEAVKAAVITCIQAVYRHQDPALSRVSEGRPWGSLEWAETISAVKRNAELLITRLTEDHCLLKPFNAHLNHIFSQNASPNLQRFSSLCRCIVAEVLPAFISRAIADDIKPQLELLANVAVAELYTSWQPEVVSRIQRLDGTLGGCVISTFVHCIQRDTQQWLLKLPQDFKLEEDRRTQQERAALKETISRLETAHKQISSIEDAFCTADPASSAFVAAVDAASRHTIADQHNLCS